MSVRRFLAALAVLGVVVAGCGGDATATAIEVVQPVEAVSVLEDLGAEAVLLDVRTPEEFNQARISGAINIDFYASDFADQLDALDKDVPYVVYCRTGNRSGSTMDIMRDLGFSQVWDVDGGIVAWSQSGLPIEP